MPDDVDLDGDEIVDESRLEHPVDWGWSHLVREV
jgi:hypothetical protein